MYFSLFPSYRRSPKSPRVAPNGFISHAQPALDPLGECGVDSSVLSPKLSFSNSCSWKANLPTFSPLHLDPLLSHSDGTSSPFPLLSVLALLSRWEFCMPSHLGNVALSFLPQPLVLNLLHVGITWEALNTTDDRVGVSPEILM